jgi:hypothetical protein
MAVVVARHLFAILDVVVGDRGSSTRLTRSDNSNHVRGVQNVAPCCGKSRAARRDICCIFQQICATEVLGHRGKRPPQGATIGL